MGLTEGSEGSKGKKEGFQINVLFLPPLLSVGEFPETFLLGLIRGVRDFAKLTWLLKGRVKPEPENLILSARGATT